MCCSHVGRNGAEDSLDATKVGHSPLVFGMPQIKLVDGLLTIAREDNRSRLVDKRKFGTAHEAFEAVACLLMVLEEGSEVKFLVTLAGAIVAHTRHQRLDGCWRAATTIDVCHQRPETGAVEDDLRQK